MNRLTASSTWPVTDANLAEIGVLVPESEKLGAVLVAEEDRLAIVAALSGVEWVSGGGRESMGPNEWPW